MSHYQLGPGQELRTHKNNHKFQRYKNFSTKIFHEEFLKGTSATCNSDIQQEGRNDTVQWFVWPTTHCK